MVPLVAHLIRVTGVSPQQADAARAADTTQRNRIRSLLRGGLKTRWLERAYTSESVNAVVAELQRIPQDALGERLQVAGFTLHPYAAEDSAQACATCMYYEVHRRFCAIPELLLPVDPDWSCRLWRI